jgi:hypothetical protein
MALKADTPNEGDELRDFSMQDFRNLCDWLSVYGMDSYFNNNSAWALRTQKMKGVHVRGAGVGKFEFTQVFFPRDYPPSFRDNMENSDPKEDGIEEISSVLDVRLSISKSIGLPLVAISRQLALGANTDPIIKTSDAGTVVVCALPASDGMPGGMPGGLMPLQYGAMYETQDWEEFLLPTKARTDKLDVSLYRQDFKDLLPEHMEALCEFVRHITGWSAKGKGKQVDLQELRNEAKKEHFERYWQLYRAQQGWGSDLPSPYNV